MASKYSVPLRTIVEENGLEPLHTSSDYDTRLLTVADVNRPALQLAGFYNYFDPNRLQIIGRVESTYLELKTEAERRSCFEELMRYDISALVICHGASAFPECLEVAGKYGRDMFVTPEDTSVCLAVVISTLHPLLAPRTTMHGVRVEVHGEGVLLTGDSGIGKSETALELIKRGHRLIADDAVEIRRVSSRTLVGSAPDNIRHFIELRGVGIIHARRLFGIGAVKMTEKIDMVVQLEPWDNDKVYDRLGLDNEYVVILGIKVPLTVVPVKPGRNLSIIIEAAAMNNRQKKMGYNAARELLHSLGMTDDIVPEEKELEVWHDF